MKKIILFCALTGILACRPGYTQVAGSGAYMKGNYLEIGIDGTYGYEGADTVTAPPPPGLHFRSDTQYFGFMANPEMNGWTTYDGDFFTPGEPENGWGIEIIDNGGTVDIIASNSRTYPILIHNNHDIIGAITSYTYLGGVHTLVWDADFDTLTYNLHFTITYTLHDTALAYSTTFTVNNMGEDIDALYYYRSIDPDNNYLLTSDYSTTNTILSQPSDTSDWASVKAEQFLPWFTGFALSAHDSTARVVYGGFENRDATDIWIGGPGGGLHPFASAPFSTETEDEAIAIACKMDSLFALRSIRSFTFISSFGGEAISTVVNNQKSIFNTEIYPNPTNGLLNINSADPVQSVMVYNTVGVLQFQSQNMSTLDLSGYADGIYLVKVKTGQSTTIRKIIKN